MKNRILSFLASIALLSLVSCTDEVQELAGEQSQALKQIVMTTQDFQPEAGSRTFYQIADGVVKCTWAANDTVGVFPSKGAQAYFSMASGVGTKNATFDGEGWALKDGFTYAAYYLYIGNAYLDRNAVPVSYTGQKQVGNGSIAHLGDYDYMVATPTAPEFGSAQFMFKHLSALVQFRITVPKPATFTSVKLLTDTEAFVVEGKVDIMADVTVFTPTTPAKAVVLDLEDVATTEENEVVTFYLMLPPADLSEQPLKAILATDKGNVEVDIENKNFQAGTVYALSGEMESIDFGYKNGVVRMAEAGTMRQFLGDDFQNITSLKVVGPINGYDVQCLRRMLGGNEVSNSNKGKLTTLDLSDASIVEGGGSYIADYYTSNDMIGSLMFYKCSNLQEIVLPAGVTSIGNHVFQDCSSLISIVIPDGVTSSDTSAFYGCTSLKFVHITDLSAWCKITFNTFYANPLNYGANLYLNNKELTELVIPADIKQIKDYAFYGCNSIKKVTMDKGVTSIGIQSFRNCSSLTQVYCQGTTPPTINPSSTNSSFNGSKDGRTLYVPKGYLSAYQSSDWANYFGTITEME